jgi:hypothetical protein
LNLRLGWLRRGRGLRAELLQQRLKSDDHQEGEREDKQESALHAGFGLRILKVWQI